MDGNTLFGLPYDFEFALKAEIFQKKMGMPDITLPATKNPNLKPLYNRHFWHIAIIKFSQIFQNFIRKSFFKGIFSKDPFFIKFPIIAVRAKINGW